MAPKRAARRHSEAGGGEGSRLANQLIDNAEEGVEALEKRMGAKDPQAHLRPAPNGKDEEANVWYFAFGSNINKKVFEGRRMIKPAESVPAVLPGWRLEFSQPGLPYAEPAFAAVERQQEPQNSSITSANGSTANGTAGGKQLDVHGVAHRITPSQWAYVLETEGGGSAYKVVETSARTYDGRELSGVVTLTVNPIIKERLKGRNAQPSLRYLKLIREGAADYNLDPEYRAWLDTLQHYEPQALGQQLGRLLFRLWAVTMLFPVWAVVRIFRRLTGMKSANDDIISRAMRAYTAFSFRVIMLLHEVVRPLLGCGMTS